MMPGLHRAPEVAVETVDDVAYVAPLPNGPITVLEGAALVVWNAIAGDGLDEVVARVAAATGEDSAAIRDDVAAFVRTLCTAGLVREG